MGKPLGVGIVGVGNISSQYLSNIPRLPNLKLIGVTDLNSEGAQRVASEHGVRVFRTEEIFEDSEVDVILNLTLPQSHAEINKKALTHGKHVYLEKPFAISVTEGAPILNLAAEKDLRVGCAPDTFLGTGIQSSKHLIETGAIGTPIAASASWNAPGHELWHPSPQFYYQEGAGPLFDMGPYYLTALVFLLGPIEKVIGNSTHSNRNRKIHTGDLADTPLNVEVETHISALLTHKSGAQSTIMVSFEIWGSKLPTIEIYGTNGTIHVPDPNKFNDIPEILTQENREWRAVEESAGFKNSGRGFGLSEMAAAIAENRPHCASGELGFHVLEVMEAILKSATSECRTTIRSTVKDIPIIKLK